jgi:hypothetical protein
MIVIGMAFACCHVPDFVLYSVDSNRAFQDLVTSHR